MAQTTAQNKKIVRTSYREATISCPRCGSKALNKYGHLKSKKQRYLCLVCNRQFVWPQSSNPIPYRPHCPACGQRMHVYARDQKVIRFRCREYPNCRNYLKIDKTINASIHELSS
jgi:transposase-like protein